MRKPRVEIVRTARALSLNADMKIEWHARIRGANGEIVWWTETYTRRGTAKKAVLFLLNLPKTVDIRELDETGD